MYRSPVVFALVCPSCSLTTFSGTPARKAIDAKLSRGAYYWRDPYGMGFYQPPTTSSSPQMYVDFINITHKTMKGIMWGLVAGGRLVAEAKDVGTFSPGVEIKKKYGISQNVFPLQTAILQCVALGVKWADGTRDINPNLPERIKQMYASPPPNAGTPQPPKR